MYASLVHVFSKEHQINKTVFVKAHFVPVGVYRNVQVATGETKKGWFGERLTTKTEEEFVQSGFSESEIDVHRLSDDLTQKVSELNAEGYEVISVSPITSAKSQKGPIKAGLANTRGGYGYGFGYTTGLVLLARRGQVPVDMQSSVPETDACAVGQ